MTDLLMVSVNLAGGSEWTPFNVALEKEDGKNLDTSIAYSSPTIKAGETRKAFYAAQVPVTTQEQPFSFFIATKDTEYTYTKVPE